MDCVLCDVSQCWKLEWERRDVCSSEFDECQCVLGPSTNSQSMSAISAGKLYFGKLAPNTNKTFHGLMQHSPLQLRQKLIDTVDDKYHVKDMDAIVEVLGILERLPVTKDILESTRLGKTVNEFRRKVNNDYLAKRAKALVKKWRETILLPEDTSQSSQHHHQPHLYQQPPRPQNGSTLDADSILREQIAQASREGHGRTTDEIVRALEERSVQEITGKPSSSQASAALSKKQENLRKKLKQLENSSSSLTPTSAATNTPSKVVVATTDELKTNNDFVQNYLKSQSELRHQIEQQYLDSLARDEFPPGEYPSTNDITATESPPLPNYNTTELLLHSSSSKKKKSHRLSRRKIVDVSPYSSSASNSPAVPVVPSQLLPQQQQQHYQSPLTSPQLFSKIGSSTSSTKTTINITNNSNNNNNHVLLHDETESSSYYNNNSSSSTHHPLFDPDPFVVVENHHSPLLPPSPEIKFNSEYENVDNSSYRPSSISSSPKSKLPKEESLSPPLTVVRSPQSPTSSTSSSSTTNSSTRTKRSSSKKFKSNHNYDEDSLQSSPKSVRRDDDDDDNNKNYLFDEESRMDVMESSTTISFIPLSNNKTGSSLEFPSSLLLTSQVVEEDEELEEAEQDQEERREIDVETLHKEQVPNVNGNLDPSGTFHEWHETYTVPSVSGELLHILPYTVIDF